MPRSRSNPASLNLLALLGVYVALWLLVAPYAGMLYDAQLYALQALARLDPAGLGQDVFLRFESQDRYTLFSPIYAAAIKALGLETAAATLTLLLQLLWYAAALLLARKLFGLRIALLSIGLLIALPGPYGGYGLFHIAEPFLSARLPAEALSLLAIWAYLQRWTVAAAVLVLVALLIHPLMAFPVALLLALSWLDHNRPRRASMPLLALLVLVGALAGSWLLGGGTPVMDAAWIAAIHWRNAHVFLHQWQPADWNHTIQTLATLATAACVLDERECGRLVRVAFWVGATGLALTAISGEVWHLRILIEAQPWRWLWLGRFLAIVALPATILCAWSAGPRGRATALLLSAGWLWVVPPSSHGAVPMLVGAFLALLALVTWFAGKRLPEPTQQLAYRGAMVAVGLVFASAALTVLTSMLAVRSGMTPAPWTLRLMNALNLITPATLIVTGAWFLTQHLRRPALSVAVLVVGIVLLVIAWPLARQGWTVREYSGANAERFSDWRATIPRDAEVFWFDGLRETWFVLQRRSYLSISQGAGVVFSGRLAQELRRRAISASAFIAPGVWFGEPGTENANPYPLTRARLAQTCNDPTLGFVVSHDDIQAGAPSKEWPWPGSRVYLYDCKLYRAH